MSNISASQVKELREKRRREDVENNLADSKPLASILKTILKKSPSLAFLFQKGKRLSNPFKIKIGQGGSKYEGNFFPTVFDLIKKYFFKNICRNCGYKRE